MNLILTALHKDTTLYIDPYTHPYARPLLSQPRKGGQMAVITGAQYNGYLQVL